MTDKYAKRIRRAVEYQQRQDEFQREQRALNKAQRRLEKLHSRQAQEPEPVSPVPAPLIGPLHVGCLIHGTVYDWQYVENLYNSVRRNSTYEIIFHVFTEAHRVVPDHMIKHELQEWADINGPRKSWWYKMQVFNPANHSGPLLYFDLDTVILKSIDWIPKLSMRYFWATKDFRHLWRPTHRGINSSVMWWDTQRFDWMWQEFQKRDIYHLVKQYQGDQDYVSDLLSDRDLRYFPPLSTASWRWQCLDGGMNFKTRRYQAPNTGTQVDPATSILIFHGSPKPHELMHDRVVKNFWQ
jgi:hypothetical protein